MKKTIFLVLIFQSLIYYSQLEINSGQAFLDRVYFNNEKNYMYSEISGTPYYENTFNEINVSQKYSNVQGRYNIYNDEFEFKKGDAIYVLPKLNEFHNVRFLNSKLIFELKEIDGKVGYFQVLDDINKIYKKFIVKFHPSIQAVSSYHSDKPAYFELQKSRFFIEIDGNLVEVPNNKSDLFNKFSKRKDELKSYIKNNSLKIGDDQDMIKLSLFLVKK